MLDVDVVKALLICCHGSSLIEAMKAKKRPVSRPRAASRIDRALDSTEIVNVVQ